MTCRSNPGLLALQESLGIVETCQNRRPFCVMGRDHPGDGVLGSQGAALGYCHRLIHLIPDPEAHTFNFTRLLAKLGAPCPRSHEFCLTPGQPEIGEFLKAAIRPLELELNGRVPVVITFLDPFHDMGEIERIMKTHLNVVEDASILLWVVLLKGTNSIEVIVRKMRAIIDHCHQTRTMPR